MTRRRKRIINAFIDGLFYSELGQVWGKSNWLDRLALAHLNHWFLRDLKTQYEYERT